jgi:hypothetical protein
LITGVLKPEPTEEIPYLLYTILVKGSEESEKSNSLTDFSLKSNPLLYTILVKGAEESEK